MSAQPALKVSGDSALNSLLSTDRYYRYWSDVLSHEQLSARDRIYKARIQVLLDRLESNEIILPIRCASCSQFFDQGSSMQWRKFCTTWCRRQSRLQTLREGYAKHKRRT